MIRTSHNAGIATIALDRAAKRNAMTPRMLELLVEAIESAARSTEVRAIVLTGEGEAFCAGFDLTLCRGDDTVLESLLSGLSFAVRSLRRAPQPVVAAAHGAAIAGGCALLGGCDVVVTNAQAKLGYPVVRLGISPAVSAPTLRLMAGDGASRARLLDSALIDGVEARRIGLAHECTAAADEVLSRAMAIAQELAGKPASGVRATKKWLNELDGLDDGAILDSALGASLGLVGSDEQHARLEALWSKP
ncbi:MAG: enoyl-CoA hydratase/isomerase family protein [Phycisphaeraceae bacterium]|nr:enoyl-CoA hydratase/isomerase family protein [Phycisphaeraceae bacterium]